VYDFERDLPPGLACSFTPRPGLRTLAGQILPVRPAYAFNTGGPKVINTYPYNSGEVREEQSFLVELNTPAVPVSISAHARCVSFNQARAVELLPLAEVERLFKQYQPYQAPGAAPKNFVALRCAGRLENSAPLQLVWGAGIQSIGGVPSGRDQLLNYRVRPVLTYSHTCEREPCYFERPIQVRFSAPISRAQAQALTLTLADGRPLRPHPVPEGMTHIAEVNFPGPFVPLSAVTLRLPGNIVDEDGRRLGDGTPQTLALTISDMPSALSFPSDFGIVERNWHRQVPITLQNMETRLPVRVQRIDTNDEAALLRELQRYASFPRYEASRTPLIGDHVAAETRVLTRRQVEKSRETVFLDLPKTGLYFIEPRTERLRQRNGHYTNSVHAALVTNLSVQYRLGKENSLVWVTSLDRGLPVAGAAVRITDCNGTRLWQGSTDAQGRALIGQWLGAMHGSCANRPEFSLITARSGDDLGFTLTGWEGRFSFWSGDISRNSSGVIAHTVLDRPLFRAGETVHMQHYVRDEVMRGLAQWPPGDTSGAGGRARPVRAQIYHEASRQNWTIDVSFDANGNASGAWQIPADAKLGNYIVHLELDSGHRESTQSGGQFRVEEFRLPTMKAEVLGPAEPQVAPAAVPLNLKLNYLSGGGVAQAVRIRAETRAAWVSFPGYENFSFPFAAAEGGSRYYRPDTRVLVEKLAVQLDAKGEARVVIDKLPKVERPTDLLVEMEFADANGETQTVAQTVRLWPAAVLLGIMSPYWGDIKEPLDLQVLALSPRGALLPGVAVSVDGKVTQTTYEPQYQPGGRVTYKESTQVKELPRLCSGNTDERGLLRCRIDIKEAGSLTLTASARDPAQHLAQAAQSLWMTGGLFRAPNSTDSVAVLPDQRQYKPGDTAHVQIRLPYAPATVLVAIEREGIVETSVRRFETAVGVIDVPVLGAYAPNIYVSATAVSGRTEVPAKTEAGAAFDPGAPRLRFGVAGFSVSPEAFQLQVAVSADKAVYRPRDKAKVRIAVRDSQGKPVPGGEVVVAAVDEALLQLKANGSWDALAALLRKRGYQVSGTTSLAKLLLQPEEVEILKSDKSDACSNCSIRSTLGAPAAAPPAPVAELMARTLAPGGAPEEAATLRELFDTLLLWQTRVKVDAQGNAEVEVPLNDSLSEFRIVAIASAGSDKFGTGAASVRATKPLQIVAGLPPLMREGDNFRAGVTLRNTEATPLEVTFTARPVAWFAGQQRALPEHSERVRLNGKTDLDAGWNVAVPAGAERIDWTFSVSDEKKLNQDGLKFTQKIVPSVPVTVQQATLAQVNGSYSLPVALPRDALPGRGAVSVTLANSLVGSLEGVKRYAIEYPHACLEQQVSVAVVLDERARWERITRQLGQYLDGRGFAKYWPQMREGSLALTAYLVVMAHETRTLQGPALQRMEAALAGYMEGRSPETGDWSPRPDAEVRKLLVLNALSYTGQFRADWLRGMTIDPNALPTASLLDWLGILTRQTRIAEQPRLLAEARRLVRARMDLHGTTLNFSTERDDNWWWLMSSPDSNALRALRLGVDTREWDDSLPRMARGAILRQRKGAWSTTVANAWGALAVRAFAGRFERVPVAGTSTASLAEQSRSLPWPAGSAPAEQTVQLPWPAAYATAPLKVSHQGQGQPWVTVQSRAAVPLKAPFWSGFRIKKTVEVLQRRQPGMLSKGDVLRVRLELEAQSDMTWVAVNDPVPGGATILSRGLARDSQLATRGEERRGWVWPSHEENGFEAFRAYYQYVPKGKWQVDYTLRLNNEGEFLLPQTRVEAMYAPEMFGELPNARVVVKP